MPTTQTQEICKAFAMDYVISPTSRNGEILVQVAGCETMATAYWIKALR